MHCHRQPPPLPLASFVALALLLSVLAQPATASDARNGIDLGVALTYVDLESGSGDQFDIGAVLLRYHHRFNNSWGIEAALTAKDELATAVQDPVFLDVSARWTFFENLRAEVFMLFGGGMLWSDEIVTLPPTIFPPITDTRSREQATAHLGVGILYDATDRVYLRADTKYRRLIDFFSPLEGGNFETSFGLGLHF
ncbi:MAG: outer membrane beta-barrel protein [Acidobacteriota bacterium]